MSSNGGYGFVLNGKETIIFVGKGTDSLDNFGSFFVDFLKTNDLEDLKSMVSQLKEATLDEEPLSHQYNPQQVLEKGAYSDGSWVITTGIDRLYMVDFDKNRLEIYRSGRHKGKIPGRFGKGAILTGNENRNLIPILMAMYPLDVLPEDLRWLEDNQYDLFNSPLAGEPGVYDTSGDPTFIHPDLY